MTIAARPIRTAMCRARVSVAIASRLSLRCAARTRIASGVLAPETSSAGTTTTSCVPSGATGVPSNQMPVARGTARCASCGVMFFGTWARTSCHSLAAIRAVRKCKWRVGLDGYRDGGPNCEQLFDGCLADIGDHDGDHWAIGVSDGSSEPRWLRKVWNEQ